MKVYLLREWKGYDRASGQVRDCHAGETVSVYHAAGTRLIYRRLAKWVGQEPGDPDWTPAAPLQHKAIQPQFNRMVTGGLNK